MPTQLALVEYRLIRPTSPRLPLRLVDGDATVGLLLVAMPEDEAEDFKDWLYDQSAAEDITYEVKDYFVNPYAQAMVPPHVGLVDVYPEED